jgi:hypothetical protein
MSDHQKKKSFCLAGKSMLHLPGAGVLLSIGLFLFLSLSADMSLATEVQHQTPIVLKSTTTIEWNNPNPIIDIPSDIPANFILELIPAGGTFTVRFDGDLVAAWDSNSVSVGNSFELPVYFDPNDSSVGRAKVRFSYLMQPSYRIDLKELGISWGKDFPDSVLQGRFPLTDFVYESIIQSDTAISDEENSLFLLDNAFENYWQDTQVLSLVHHPYPCVELTVNANVNTTLYYTLAMDELCIRYSSSEDDTLCWDAENGFDCQISHSPGWPPFSITVPCEEVADLIVPLCPIKASGQAHVEIGTEVIISQIKLAYTCPSTPASLSDAPPATSAIWLEQELSLGTDKDDAIFTVPVPLEDIDVNVLAALDDTLQNGDSLYAYSNYTIAWTSLDATLDACCDYDSLRIVFRDTILSDSGFCWGIMQEPISGDETSFSWNVPDIECLDNDMKFRLYIEYYCPATDKVLYCAWSETFFYVKSKQEE